ncbi:MAG: glycine betaine ABC transporter substrate-binding protein [Firmicutes bacterium]|nr:glycine betaine ABC transporter substrate-binding protein [Bacillota bacterium]
MNKSWLIGLIVVGLVALAIFMWPRADTPPEDNGIEPPPDNGGEQVEPEDVTIGYVNWACATATGHLVQTILEEDMEDVTVELTDLGAALMWQSLATGDLDFILSAWLPVTHSEYYAELEDDVVRVRENYQGAQIGLVVPTYVEIDSITELNENAEQFEGRIVGIDAGAGIMGATEEAIEVYELDLTLVDSSDAAMAAELQTAIDNEEWIVVTGWSPHWKFAEFELKFLEDPENVYGGEESIFTITREGFAEDNPRVQRFLENFFMTPEQLGSLMGMIEDIDDIDEAVQQWIDENREVVNGWLPE